MSDAHFSADTLDDLLRVLVDEVLANGTEINPTKGPAKELMGVTLELTNPLARLSRTASRGRLFSCLGELMWYLAKSNKLAMIQHYIPLYEQSADGDEIFGGYGPRLFDWHGINQFRNVRDLLRDNPDTRRAVVQLFSAHDIVEPHKDVPCTCSLQFMRRNDRLHMITTMRSNDMYLGLPHDIFCFTMLQEIMARDLGVELGKYVHMVGSMHIYRRNVASMNRFLGEGWQPTSPLMCPMPVGEPWTSIQTVIKLEHAIRTDHIIDDTTIEELDPYWADLVKLLQVFKASKDENTTLIKKLQHEMSSTAYDDFIDQSV